MRRLSASLPYVQGRLFAIAVPPGASRSGELVVPAKVKSGKVIAISRTVRVADPRILAEIVRPTDSVKTAIRIVVKKISTRLPRITRPYSVKIRSINAVLRIVRTTVANIFPE